MARASTRRHWLIAAVVVPLVLSGARWVSKEFMGMRDELTVLRTEKAQADRAKEVWRSRFAELERAMTECKHAGTRRGGPDSR